MTDRARADAWRAPSFDAARALAFRLLRAAGIIGLALALIASGILTYRLVGSVRRDPDLTASVILSLAAIAVLIALIVGVGVVELTRRGHVAVGLATSMFVLVGLRGAAIAGLPTPLTTDWLNYHELATTLARGMPVDTARPIGWPAALGAVYALGGPDPVLGELFNLGAMIVSGLLLFWVTHRSFGPVAGVAATFLYAISPAPSIFVAVLASEPLFTALLLVATALAVYASERSWWAWIAAGLALALAQYVRPAALILLPGFLAVPLLTVLPLRRAVVASLLVIIAFVVPLVPNAVIQYEQTGRLTLSTSRYDGWNLLVGLNERSGGSYSSRDRALFADIPETSRQWIDSTYGMALDRLRDDPTVVVRLAPKKFQKLWGDATYAARFVTPGAASEGPLRPFLALVSQGVHLVILGLGLIGLLVQRSFKPVVVLVVACLVTTTMASALLEVQARYHAPFEPFLCLLAGIGVAACWERVVDLRRSVTPQA